MWILPVRKKRNILANPGMRAMLEWDMNEEAAYDREAWEGGWVQQFVE